MLFSTNGRNHRSRFESQSRLLNGCDLARASPSLIISTVFPCNIKTIIFSSFHRIFLDEIVAFFVRETARLFAKRAPGLSGNFYARALKLIADTEHGVGTGPAPYRIDSVRRSVGARACILKLEDCTGSVGSSQTNFNFVFVLSMPCHDDEADMNAPEAVQLCTPPKPTGNGGAGRVDPDGQMIRRIPTSHSLPLVSGNGMAENHGRRSLFSLIFYVSHTSLISLHITGPSHGPRVDEPHLTTNVNHRLNPACCRQA
jgi:hypothetical protein